MDTGINSWKCSVCGYVSEKDTPPDSCPVCGVPKDKFEKFLSAPKATIEHDVWRCMVCNHHHEGSSPPVNCPVCGVTSEKFEGITTKKKGSEKKGKREVVIIGAGIAGITAAHEIRNLSEDDEITLIHKGENIPYYRLNLTRYIGGEVNLDDLPLHPESWYNEKRINLLRNSSVEKINRDKNLVILRDGSTFSFDKLLITTGSHPFVPPVPGSDFSNVTTLRTLEDSKKIIENSDDQKSIVIIGGGVLGLEVAGGLSQRNKNLNVTVVEGFEYLMPRQLNKKAAGYLKNHFKNLGVKIITGTSVSKIEGNNSAESVVLANGDSLPADSVIFSVGVRPDTYLARGCGIKVNTGVIVNDNMETSVPGIYAAGDITEHRGIVYGLWNAAMFQGKIAGMNISGEKADFGGIPRSNTLKVLDVNLFSIGGFNPCDGSCISIEEEANETYSFILFRDGKIEGGVLYGDTKNSSIIKTAIEQKISFPHSIISEKKMGTIIEYLTNIV